MNNLYIKDKSRGGKPPIYQYFYRQSRRNFPIPLIIVFKALLSITRFLYKVELSSSCEIGEGLYIGHPFCITINPKAKIGKNCNIHKGVTIGQENRGNRKGVPTIGDCVWIGVNATIVGNIKIGNDVLIAPNSYVNRDVPSHSVVFGNPCVIKHKEHATEDYINNKV